MSFLYVNYYDEDEVHFQKSSTAKRVIYIIKGYRFIYIDNIFETWFERGLLRASLNEQVLFDLEFGDGEYFKLLSFVHMLEKRVENK